MDSGMLHHPLFADQAWKAHARWKERPYDADLADALSGRGDRRLTVLAMLRRRDVPAILKYAKEQPTGSAEAFHWLWQSGLFDEARRLASSADLQTEVDLTGTTLRENLAARHLWGNSESMCGFMGRLRDAAAAVRREPPVMNIWLGGPSGPEKVRAARSIHDLARRGMFSELGPECKDPKEAVRAAMAGGSLFLARCDELPAKQHAAVFQAMVDRCLDTTPLDTLLIVDTEGEQDGGTGLWASLRKTIVMGWSHPRLPKLLHRREDIPLLVNKTLERMEADDLADVRHHLADALGDALSAIPAQFEVGRLEGAVTKMCGLLCPDWRRPTDSAFGLKSQDVWAEERQATAEPPTPMQEDADQNIGNSFKLTSAGWSVILGGVPVTISGTTKGMRAIGHLLLTRMPPGGASEVAGAMDAGLVEPASTKQHEEDGHVIDLQIPQPQLTPAQVNHSRQVAKEGLADIKKELGMDSTTRERREQLEEEKQAIRRLLSGLVNIRGESREWGSKESRRVGKAIDRAMVAINRHAGRAADTQERDALKALHRHLKDYIKERYSDNIRYEPPDGTRWTVVPEM